MPEDISVGELSRQVASVLLRFEHLATRLDESYVSKSLYDLYTRGLDKELADLNAKVSAAAAKEALQDKADTSALVPLKNSITELERRVKKIEDNVTWAIRVIGTFIILGVLAAVFATSGIQK